MNKYTEDDYINKCKELDLEYIGNHKEFKLGTVIDFKCNKHKDIGIQHRDWSHFRNTKKPCKICNGRGITIKDFISRINNPNIEFLSEYVNSETKLHCKCRICGHEWYTKPRVLDTNKSSCPYCGKIKRVKSRTKSKESFRHELALINPNIEVIGDYINTHTKIKCRCRICNCEWFGYPANLLNQTAGCPSCNISIGERKLLNTLESIGISYIPQYTFDDLENKKKLRFDAYDINNNILFEYQGEQHYYPVDWGNKGEKWAKEEFELTQSRDNLKREYCNVNNIPVIEIPYWERDNMECFILSKIKEIKEEVVA